MKRKRLIIFILLGIFLIGSGIFFSYQNQQQKEKQALLKKEQEEQERYEQIKNNYAEQIKTTKETSLYRLEEEQYQEVGKVKEGTTFFLEPIETLTKDTTYFQLKDTPYYISYDSVTKEESSAEKRYQNYVPFPLKIKTQGNTSFYDQNGTEILTLNESIEAEVIEQTEEYFFISLFDQLLGVKKDQVEETIELPEEPNIATSIPVLNYHFIYLSGDTSCQESICHSEEQIRSHFSYLRDIGAFTLTTTELEKFIKGEIQLPKKSVLITIDDGARAENFIPLLEEYGLYATLFLVTAWYPKETFSSPYLELASHTHNLHTVGVCPGGQGSEIRCLGEEQIQADLKQSREILNNTTAFCYPFYEYNDYAIEQVQKAGFTTGFIGESRNVTTATNPYLIPRYPIQSTTGVSFLESVLDM